MNLSQFINPGQLKTMRYLCRGEECEHFKAKIAELKNTIAKMPVTYQTDGQGDKARAHLHYFINNSDWWILERDIVSEHQIQAFGFACLNGDAVNAELGYISIEELINNNVELDIYYTPETIKEIREKLWKR